MAGKGAPKGNTYRRNKPLKRTIEIQEKLAAMGCDPIEGMARIALEAESGFVTTLTSIAQSNDIKEINELIPEFLKNLTIAGNMYKELAQYVAPKRKAIEHQTGLASSQSLTLLSDEDLHLELRKLRESNQHLIRRSEKTIN